MSDATNNRFYREKQGDLSSNPRALIENLVGYVKETTDHPGFVKALQAIELALSPAAKFDDLKKQCQCLWRTDATLVCRLPKGHEGDHREGAFTWNGEVDTRAAHEPATVRPEDLAAALAHRACCGVEHDPAQGKLHGYCVVCGVPWPCDTAKHFLRPPPTEPAK